MRILIGLLLLAAIAPEAHSQSTKGKKLLMAPKVYLRPTGEIQGDDYTPMNDDRSNLWFVFSDRADNKTYKYPEATATSGKVMNFMEPFYVIEMKKGFLHLVKYTSETGFLDKSYKLTADLEDYGWAPVSNLVLWNNSLVDPYTKFTIKALTSNKIETLNDIPKYVSGKSLKIFSDPDLRTQNSNQVNLFDFLYVFKRSENGDALLVGVADKLFRAQAKFANKKVLGWVSKDVISEWKDRITIEPNWEPAAANERNSKGIKSSIYFSDQAAASYKKGGSTSANPLWNKDPFSTRNDPYWKRLPYLAADPATGIVKTGAVTPVFNKNAQEVIDEYDQNKIERSYAAQRENYRKINIIFVVDANEVMKDYKQDISFTLQDCANRLNRKSEEEDEETGTAKNSYKLGLVVYRSYNDDECSSGFPTTDGFDLTTNYRDVFDKFQSCNFGSCNPRETRTAMYGGLRRAMRMLQGAETQSNVIIHIGAAANNDDNTKITQKDIIAQLAKYSVAMLSFQAKHPIGDAYDNFFDQVKALLKGEIQIRRDSIQGIFGDKKKFESGLYGSEDEPNLLKFDCPKRSPLPGGIMFCDKLNPLEPKALNTQVNKLIDELLDTKEKIFIAADAKLKGQGVRSSDIDEGLREFLSRMKVNVDLLRSTSYDNIQLFVEGYTSMNCEKLNYPLYKYTLFVSYTELQDMINALTAVMDKSEDKTERRVKMKNAFITLLGTRISPKEVKKQMATMTVAKFSELVTGLPTQNTLLASVKLDDISKPKIVTDDKLDEITNYIADKIDALDKYRADSRFKFTSQDTDYYWVPEDLLP
jgi:hypothetical protein